MQVFFLADRAERNLQYAIHQHLLQNGISVWMDGASHGGSFDAQMKKWLADCKLIIVLATPRYLSSAWFKQCWAIALQVSTQKLVIALDGATFDVTSPHVSVAAAATREEVAQLILAHILRSTRSRIFISYSRRDKPLVELITGLLSMSLNEHWIDTSNLVEGRYFPEQIKAAIEECDTFLLIWSVHAAQSEWVAKELKHALDLDKLILPILVDDTPLPTAIATIHSFKSPLAASFLERFNIPDQQPEIVERFRSFFPNG
jgi:TIR domain